MSFSIWKLQDQAEEGSIHSPGDQTRYDEAKALVEAVGGLLQVGPGSEATVLGTFLGTKTVLVQVTNDGRYIVSGLRFADLIDPTKRAFFDPSGIAAATQRVITLPDWNGLLPLPSGAGTVDQFLRSGGAGVQPAWAANPAINALLDGANHSDTLAGGPVAGDLIFANATPKWARLPKGADGQVLLLASGLPSWGAVPSVSHDALAHLKPFTVANCTSNAADTIVTTTTPNGFANVKVGDRIDGTFISESSGASNWYFKTVTQVDSTTQIRTSGTKNAVGTSTVSIFPNDHTGLLLLGGRGDALFNYSVQPHPDAGCQLAYGSYRFLPGPAGLYMVEFKGVTNPANPDGFCLRDDANGARFFFDFQNPAVGNYVITFPFGGSETLIGVSFAQQMANKTMTTGNKLRSDGTGTYTVFQTTGGADRLGFDLTPMSALRSVSWPDYAGRARVEGAPVTFANGDTTPSVSGSRVFLTNNAGATSITTFDDAVDGQEISVIAGDNNTTIVAGANMKTPAGANVVLTTDDVVRLVKAGATWFVETVSVNA